MKDVISILQSRIAKRLKEFRKLMLPVYKDEAVFGRSSYNLIRPALSPNHPRVVALAAEQKEDKRILAEIVKLRRVAKMRKRQEAIMVALDSVYDPDMSDYEEEIQTAIMAAHFGER